MATIETKLEYIQKSYDWEEVFGEGNGGNTDRTVEAAPPGSKVSTEQVARADIAEVIASVEGEKDETDWVGVFLMKDARYLVAVAACDYTGWDCQARNSLTVFASLADAIRFGLDDAQRVRLGLNL